MGEQTPRSVRAETPAAADALQDGVRKTVSTGHGRLKTTGRLRMSHSVEPWKEAHADCKAAWSGVSPRSTGHTGQKLSANVRATQPRREDSERADEA